MTRTHSVLTSGAIALLAAAAVAGCGSSSHATAAASQHTAGNSAATPASSGGSSAAATLVIGSFKTPQDGTLITGAGHRTLYALQNDLKASSAHDKLSTCYQACTAAWPPVLASQLPAVSGLAEHSLIGLTRRKDGAEQVTYNGLPLYYYAADRKPGQSVGNHLKDGFGLWLGVLPSGKLAPDGAS